MRKMLVNKRSAVINRIKLVREYEGLKELVSKGEMSVEKLHKHKVHKMMQLSGITENE